MANNDFVSFPNSSAHDKLMWNYISGLSEQEIEAIMVHAETKTESIAHGRLLSGRPISQKIRNRLVQTAILREINFRAG